MYGMSAFRLASSLGIPRKQAQGFIDSYFEMYSGIRAFISDTVQQALDTGSVQTILGRKRRILAINSRNLIKELFGSIGAESINVFGGLFKVFIKKFD